MTSFRASSATNFYNPGVLGGDGANSVASYTKGQVGAAAKPNFAPAGATGWAGTNASPDPRRTQYPGVDAPDPVNVLPIVPRAFRGRGRGAVPDVIVHGPGTQMPSGATTFNGTTDTFVHNAAYGFTGHQPDQGPTPAYPATSGRSKFRGGSNAVPQISRQWDHQGNPAGYPLGVSPAAYPDEYMTQNQAILGNNVNAQGTSHEWMNQSQGLLNQRPKAGGTSADNYRNARRWIQTPSMRPFDKAAGVYGMLGRHSLPNPLASTPLYFPDDVAGGVPSPGGKSAAPGMRPVGIQQNTSRLQPQAWDQTLVNTSGGDGTAQVQTGYRARAWKAGG